LRPVLTLEDQVVVGWEALARFTVGDRRPDEWFAHAACTGLGPALDARCADLALRTPGRPASAYLAINASPSALASEVLWEVLPEDLDGIVVEVTATAELATGLLAEARRMSLPDSVCKPLADLAHRGNKGSSLASES